MSRVQAMRLLRKHYRELTIHRDDMHAVQRAVNVQYQPAAWKLNRRANLRDSVGGVAVAHDRQIKDADFEDTQSINELVRFRLWQMPCCGQLLCWLNPRLPNYCPECGKQVYHDMKHLVPLSQGDKLLNVGEFTK